MFRAFAAIALAVSFILSVPPSPHADERVQHYAAESIKNSADALAAITQKVGAIEAFEKEGKMEAIHEQTYTLEAAVDKLRAEKFKDTQSLDALDEAVQTIHFASEHGKAKEVKAVLPKLKDAAQRVAKK